MDNLRRVEYLLLVFIIFATAFTSVNIYGSYIIQLNVRSSASIQSMFGLYFDVDCTEKVSTLNWGSLEPGSHNILTIYVRNVGSRSSIVRLSSRNWTPSKLDASTYLSWNLENATVKPNEIRRAELTLHIGDNMFSVSELNFEVIISVTEA